MGETTFGPLGTNILRLTVDGAVAVTLDMSEMRFTEPSTPASLRANIFVRGELVPIELTIFQKVFYGESVPT